MGALERRVSLSYKNKKEKGRNGWVRLKTRWEKATDLRWAKEKGKAATAGDCSSQVDTTTGLFSFGFGSGCGLVVLWEGRVSLGDEE